MKRVHLLLLVAGLTGCTPLLWLHPGVGPSALIARDSAVFVFPAETLATLTWNPRTPGTNPVGVDWTWAIDWESGAPGTDSAAVIAVNRRHRAGEPVRHGRLGELLAETTAEEGTPCWRCHEPAVKFTPVSGIVAYARGNQ